MLRYCSLTWHISVVGLDMNHQTCASILPRFILFQTNHSGVIHFWVNILTVRPRAR